MPRAKATLANPQVASCLTKLDHPLESWQTAAPWLNLALHPALSIKLY